MFSSHKLFQVSTDSTDSASTKFSNTHYSSILSLQNWNCFSAHALYMPVPLQFDTLED